MRLGGLAHTCNLTYFFIVSFNPVKLVIIDIPQKFLQEYTLSKILHEKTSLYILIL